MTNLGADADVLVAREYAPITFLLGPWLASPSLSILWAWRGVGKSWCALSIAHSVAIGGSWLGWSAPRAAKVCYIDGELGGRYLQERIVRVDLSGASSAIGSNLRIVTLEDAPENVMWNLASPRDQNIYSEIVKDYELIIIDNIATTVRPAGRGLSTDVETWASVQAWAIQQRSRGKSVMFIDHAGKSGTQRGTSTKEDVMDTIISLSRDSDYDPAFGAEFNLRFEKSRHFHGEGATALRVALKDAENGQLVWEWRPLKDHVDEKLRSLLRKRWSIPAILASVNVSRARIEQVKEALRREESEREECSRGNRNEESDDTF